MTAVARCADRLAVAGCRVVGMTVAGRTARAAAVGRVVRWRVVWRLVVVGRWFGGLASACWRGYRGQGAQQQPEVNMGAQQVRAAARPRGPQR
ncbi:MAG TPA: hypothetical protein VGG25_13705, partial [Streptosporangiaceae bacterium]